MTSVVRVAEPDLFDEPAIAKALRVTLVAILVSALAISAVTLFLRWRLTPQLALAAGASCLVALVVSRSGRTRPAMMLPLLSITYAVLHLAARSDGIQNIGLAVLPVLIMVSSLLLDRRTLVFFTAGIIFGTAGMLAIRYFVLRAERYSTNDMGDLFIFALTCATTALLGRLLAVRIQEGFRLVRDGESRYRKIFENVQDVYCEMSAGGILLELSPASSALFGLPREAMVGSPLAAFCANRSEFEALIEKLRTLGRVSNHELALRDSHGEIRTALVNASLQNESKAGEERMIGSIRDITERKRLEEELRRRAEELYKIMDVAPVALFVAHDPDCQKVTGNRMANHLAEAAESENLSLSAPERVAQRPRFFSAGIEIPFEELPLQMAARGVEVRDRELETQEPNGTKRLLWGQASPLRDTSGKVRGAVAAFLDVTSARQRTDALLRESEERFRNVANNAPVMIWVAGPDKLGSFFNKPWLDFRGRTLEQELGQGWVEGVHPEDRERCSTIYSAAFDSRRPFQKECRLRRADGEYRWVLDNGIPVYRAGEFAGFIGSCVDITEQKRMADRLRDQQIQLIDAQRLAKIGSWERDDETGMIRWSDEMLRILGRNNPSQTLQDFLDYIHPNDRQKVRAAAAKIPSCVAPVEVSYRMTRPDGEVRFLRAVVEAIRDHSTARTVGSVQDITEQVEAERLVRESEERLKSAERLTHVGHWHRDLKSGQVTWSDESSRIFGQPRGYAPNQEEFFQLISPQDREMVAQKARHCFEEKGRSSIEFRIVRPDGDLRTVMSVSEVLLDEDGQPASVFGAFQDITEAKRAQEETTARQKLESVGTLANGIAHDFNNLLGGVLAQAELALSELGGGVNPEEELRAIRDVAIRGSEIVRQLMIYAGKETAAVALVDVSRVVREMLELLKFSVSKHAVLETDLDEGLPAVKANAAQLRQIVMNLVTNASDAIGDRDGVIRVTTRWLRAGQKPSGGASGRLAEGDYLELEVSDTGCGIPVETQAKVFDPFFTSKSGGHGLGLSIVDGIVRSLGGAIHLTSQPGKGTTFQIWLPSADTAAGATNGAVSGVEELRSPSRLAATVLVVEDESPLRQAVTKLLRKTGFEVFECADGSDAIDLLRANYSKINVVLLDVTIPGASSAEVAAEAARVRPGINVVLTSAYSQEMLVPLMSASRVHSFIRKPYQLADLVQALRSASSS